MSTLIIGVVTKPHRTGFRTCPCPPGPYVCGSDFNNLFCDEIAVKKPIHLINNVPCEELFVHFYKSYKLFIDEILENLPI